METDWSCFVNPWSNRIEFVICKHRVIKAPKNPNVFDEDEDKTSDCVDKRMLRNSHRIDIENTLSKTLPPADPKMSCMAQRRRRLLALMENLITEMETVDQPLTPEQDHTSVPGDVSPHTSERGSPAPVSVTPPNYVQLNYKETIDRFFQSHPKTTLGSSDESDSRLDSSGAGPGPGRAARRPDEGTLPSRAAPSAKQAARIARALAGCDQPTPGTSGETTSGGKGLQRVPPANYHHQPLTQAVLQRHNADMEKNMRQSLGHKKHAGHESKSKPAKRNAAAEQKEVEDFEQERRRVMMDTPAWPAPSVFWPPFSAYYSGANVPPEAGHGYWVMDPTGVRTADSGAQPSIVVQSPCKPMYLGAVPGLLRRPTSASQTQPASTAAATAASSATAGAEPPDAAGTRNRTKPTPVGGVSSGEQSGADCTAATSESLQKMNLYSDEDDSSKEKRPSDFTFSDSSISSLPKDVFMSGEEWPNSEGAVNNGDSSDLDQTGDACQAGPSTARDGRRRPVLMDPPWLVAVSPSSDLANRYQMEPRNLKEVLEKDRQALSHMTQSATLTEQLSQLYQDLENVGSPSVFNLEERDGTSGSSDDSAAMLGKRMKRSRRVREYDRLTIVFEEDAPIPPPDLPTFHQLLSGQSP